MITITITSTVTVVDILFFRNRIDIMAFTTRGEYGWQYDKTVLECMRYMLDNEIATDVCFKVGPADGVTVSIRAHKYMLVSRSAVFEAMFSSGMSETKCEAEAVIRITDFEAGIFRELLRCAYFLRL